MEQFNIPVVLFIFKRCETTKQIINVLRDINASHIYIVADGPRNEEESLRVETCREEVEKSIDWDCTVTKNYAEKNRGVMENIGNGARWVFEREEKAIFLEDDNLPKKTFFTYCEALLERYEKNDKILWINGTNYLTEYVPEDSSSYMFTQHLLPCGWASWSKKFLKYYDPYLKKAGDENVWKKVKRTYERKKLYKQQRFSILSTKNKLLKNLPVSWDFQMCFAIRSNGLYGISPCRNQIKNIGVDVDSTHGGVSNKIKMTRRFCSMDSLPLDLPLKHPAEIKKDKAYEKAISKIIEWPLKEQVFYRAGFVAKFFLGLDKYDSMQIYLQQKRREK